MISAQSEISKKLEVERNLPYQGKTVGRQVGAEGELTGGCAVGQESGEDEGYGEEGYEGKLCEKNMKNKENMGENDRIRKRGESQGLKNKADLQSQENEEMNIGIKDSEERKIGQHVIDPSENGQVTQEKNQHANPEMEEKEIIDEDEQKEMIDEEDDEEKEVAEEDGEEEENELFQEDQESDEEEEEQEEEDEDDDDDEEEDSTQAKQNHLHSSNLTQINNKKHMNSNKFPLRQSSKNALKLLKQSGKKTPSLKTKQLPPSTDSRNNLVPKRCHNQFCKSPFKGEMKRFKIKFTNEYIHLCQKCTERFKQKKYCLYCGQVYFDSNEVDGNLWIGCEECDLWLHQECEKKYGIKDIDTLAQDDKYKFYCLRCREKSKSQLSAAMNSAASSNDKLSINIIKAQQQIANCLNTSDFQSHNAGSATPANTASLASAASTIKQTKKNKNNSEKTKGKALIATIKQLKRQIFAPKPGSQPDEGSNHAVVTPFTTENTTLNSLEHKKSKKICTEISKTPHTAHSASIKQSPHCRADRAQHSEVYSFNLFLKAKRQFQALHSSQQQQIQTQSTEEELLMMVNNPNQLCDGEPNSNNNASNQGISNYNHYHHHQRGRKEDLTNYIELPYKKQTVKETTSKKSAYHYSILQELLHPLSLSLCLGQEDINVDLQMYRSIALESRRIQRDEDQHSYQMHSLQAEDSFAAQGNLSSSSQPSESGRVNFSPSISKESSLIDAVKLKKKSDNEEYTKQQLNPISPMLSQY